MMCILKLKEIWSREKKVSFECVEKRFYSRSTWFYSKSGQSKENISNDVNTNEDWNAVNKTEFLYKCNSMSMTKRLTTNELDFKWNLFVEIRKLSSIDLYCEKKKGKEKIYFVWEKSCRRDFENDEFNVI